MTDDKTCAHCGVPLSPIDSYNVNLNHNEKLEDDSLIWSRANVYLCEKCWNKVKQVVTSDDLERIVMNKPGEGIESVDTEGWKRCPFCDGEPRAIVMEAHDSGNDTDWTGIAACHECGVRFVTGAKIHDELIAEMRRLWNARYERTCHISSSQYEPSVQLWIVTLSCGHEHLLPFEELDVSYCSECGAKVVDP